MSQWLSEVWDNLSCLNLCVHSHSACQHLNLVVTSQTCPKNTIESRVHSVIPRSTLCADTLGSDPKEIQGTACLSFLSHGKPRSCSISSALALLLSLYSTLRDVGNHHSARVFQREETSLLDGCECSLGHYVRQDPAPKKGCSKLQTVRSALAQQFVLSSSRGGCKNPTDFVNY